MVATSTTTQPNTASLKDAQLLAEVFPGYKPLPGSFDEMLRGPEELRPEWRSFLGTLHDLGPEELARRGDHARRSVRENALTSDLVHEDQGSQGERDLDPLPILISEREWDYLEAGLLQRVRLLNDLLADIYGSQRLMADGSLPAGMVFSHPGFLRPCHNIAPPNGVFLHLYAADLARGADGQWRVLADRTQAPAGPGFLLENRIAMSRMLPDIFRDLHVKRLAKSFNTLRQGLVALAPRNRDNPRVVLLAPTTTHPTYFEHAFVARYLGYTVAEGGDLTVRENDVFLKTLGGLHPVDVVLRRVKDNRCDPLELNPQSLQGAAGLVQAARAGTVAIANALGSGLLENPALRAALPSLCRRLFNEELKLPSIDTQWCGDPMQFEAALNGMDGLVFERMVRGVNQRPITSSRLSQGEREKLREQIRWRPSEWTAHHPLVPSSAPAFSGARFEARHLVMRVFVMAGPEGWEAVPGGLVRIAHQPELLLSGSRGAPITKDAWVLSSAPVENFSLLQLTSQPVALRRGGIDTPSRVAENLYWLGRYVERAEGRTRLLRSLIGRMAGETDPEDLGELSVLALALGITTSSSVFPESGDDVDATLATLRERSMRALFDERFPDSIRSILSLLHGSARITRDRLSIDTWRILGALEKDLPQHASEKTVSHAERDPSEALEILDRMLFTFAAFSGQVMENVIRGRVWGFLDIGRRLERASHTLNLLQATLTHVGRGEERALQALLEVADSSMTYRSRYLNQLQAAPVIDLLLMDETNPRAVAYQFEALTQEIDRMPRDPGLPSFTLEQKIMMQAVTRLRTADPLQLTVPDDNGMRTTLDALLTDLLALLPQLSDALTNGWFSHVETQWRSSNNAVPGYLQ